MDEKVLAFPGDKILESMTYWVRLHSGYNWGLPGEHWDSYILSPHIIIRELLETINSYSLQSAPPSSPGALPSGGCKIAWIVYSLEHIWLDFSSNTEYFIRRHFKGYYRWISFKKKLWLSHTPIHTHTLIHLLVYSHSSVRLCNIYGVGSLLEYGITVWERDVIFKLKEMAGK